MIGEILDAMKTLARRGMTLIVTTHDMGFAREASNWVLLMEDRRKLEEGRVLFLRQILWYLASIRTTSIIGP